MTAPRWLLAYNPDFPTAVMRLKADDTLWRERTWSMFAGQPATILDVTDQMPRLLEAVSALVPAGVPLSTGPDRLTQRVGFRLVDQRLVTLDAETKDVVRVEMPAAFHAALGQWRAGRAFVGCPR